MPVVLHLYCISSNLSVKARAYFIIYTVCCGMYCYRVVFFPCQLAYYFNTQYCTILLEHAFAISHSNDWQKKEVVYSIIRSRKFHFFKIHINQSILWLSAILSSSVYNSIYQLPVQRLGSSQ